MEPARSTGNFNRRITVADSNNIITVLDMNAANAKYQIFDQDYLVEFQAVLEDLKVTVGLLSLLEAPWPDTNALMSESATMAEIAKIRTQGQKVSLGLYVASGNGPWQYESEVVLQNQGGSETHVPILVPFLSSNETLLIAGNFKLGVKIEPKWNQPLKINDYLVIKGTWRQIVSFSKKKDDDVEMLSARIASLELAVNGKLINLPANTLLGRNNTKGTIESIDRATFKAADSDLLDGVDISRVVFGDEDSKSLGGGGTATTNNVFTTSGFIDVYGASSIFPAGINHLNGFQTRHRNSSNFWGMQAGCQHNIPNEFYFRTITAGTFNPWNKIWNSGNLPIQYPVTGYGSIAIPGASTGYAGIRFTSATDGAVLMFGANTRDHGVWSLNAANGGWHWLYDNGNLNIYSSTVVTDGGFIGLYKGLNSLPGYPNSRHPTLRTDNTHLFFSIGGVYSAHMTPNGVLTSVSDRNKKENLLPTNDVEILKLLLQIPTYTYNFKESDTRIRNLSCMAQDFYAAFGLGGDVEIDEDESPISPSRMLAPSDAIGVCMAAIKGLYKLINKNLSN